MGSVHNRLREPPGDNHPPRPSKTPKPSTTGVGGRTGGRLGFSGIHTAALASHELSFRSLVTVVSKVETSPVASLPVEPNINHCWRKCCLQREMERQRGEARANRWFAALLILNPWYLTHRKAAGNFTSLKEEGMNNSRSDESWWQLLYAAKMGK